MLGMTIKRNSIPDLPPWFVCSDHIVYALTDEYDRVRYIGCSSVGMARPRAHYTQRNFEATPKSEWLRSMADRGLDYGITVLEEFESHEDALAGENRWIAKGRELGWPLTNTPRDKVDLDVEAIARAYSDGESQQSIAERLGVSRPTIVARLERAGVERRPKGAAVGMSNARRRSNAG